MNADSKNDRATTERRALLTDLYQLTMACGYWKSGRAEREAVFHLFFRHSPFQCGFTLTAGLAPTIEFLQSFRFTKDDLAFLSTLRGNDDQPLFDRGFLDYLETLRFSCDVDAIPEGTAVFPQEPLLRIQGPILQCQLFETALLNPINFQWLIATKAARVCLAARGEPVLEFGLRRAQGVDGALAASRAAYIGGCAATSNVLAAKLYGIPVRGTHAHSWVMSFDDEREAFRAYAEAMPNNCVFLVDTYNTLEGVRRAVEVGRLLRERGHEMVGIRLDSGDLAWLSVEARKILDAAGFPNAVIVASNDLDEHIIASLKEQGAMINVWGVGTKLVTADSAAVSCLVSLACELALNELGRDGVRIKLGHIRNLPKELTPRSLTNALLTTFYQATENSGPITRAAARAVAEAVGATHFEFDLGKLHRGYLETVESALGRKFDWESDDLGLHSKWN